MRRFGACRTVMTITWVTFGLGWLAIIGVPPFSGLLVQGQDHRGGVRRRGLAALGVRADRADRRRHHRVLHDPPDLHDLPRREALARGRQHPHESPPRHDRPADRAGGRLGLPRLALSHRRRDRQLAQPPVGGERRGGHPVLPVPAHRGRSSCCSSSSAPRCAWLRYAPRPGAATVAPAGNLAHPRRPQRPLPGRGQRGPVHAPRHHLTRPLVFFDRTRRRRRGRRAGRAHRRHVRSGASAADRLRPLLRAVHARSASSSSSARVWVIQ